MEEVPIAITVAFFVLYFVMGNLVLLNLFIATILEKLKIIDGATEPTITDAAKVCVPTALQLAAYSGLLSLVYVLLSL